MTDRPNQALKQTPWMGWLALAVLTAWLVSDWLRTLVYAITNWGLLPGLVDGVALLRLAEALILLPLALHLLVLRRDERSAGRLTLLMWAGALLAAAAFLGLRGRVGWAPLAAAIALAGLIVPAFIRIKTGCLARLLPPLGLVGLVLLALLVNLGGFLLHGYTVVPYPAAYPARAGSGEEARRQDVRYLGSELARLHKNAYHSISEQTYQADLTRLEAAAPGMSDAQLALEQMRFVAAVGDGHTSFQVGPPSPLRGIPVDLGWYGDELYVRGISSAYPEAVGARVLQIGDLSAEAVYQAALAYIPHENDAWARVQSGNYLNLVDLLVRVGAASSPAGPVTLNSAGQRRPDLCS